MVLPLGAVYGVLFCVLCILGGISVVAHIVHRNGPSYLIVAQLFTILVLAMVVLLEVLQAGVRTVPSGAIGVVDGEKVAEPGAYLAIGKRLSVVRTSGAFSETNGRLVVSGKYFAGHEKGDLELLLKALREPPKGDSAHYRNTGNVVSASIADIVRDEATLHLSDNEVVVRLGAVKNTMRELLGLEIEATAFRQL